MKRSKIDLFRSQYENFYINENKSIDEILTHLTKIINGLSSFGDKIDNDQKVRKVIRDLLKSWEVKVNTLKELNNKEEMDFFGFIGSLKTYEMERKAREEREPQKKKSVAFKVHHSFWKKMKI